MKSSRQYLLQAWTAYIGSFGWGIIKGASDQKGIYIPFEGDATLTIGLPLTAGILAYSNFTTSESETEYPKGHAGSHNPIFRGYDQLGSRLRARPGPRKTLEAVVLEVAGYAAGYAFSAIFSH